jgi:hypothetical protein
MRGSQRCPAGYARIDRAVAAFKRRQAGILNPPKSDLEQSLAASLQFLGAAKAELDRTTEDLAPLVDEKPNPRSRFLLFDLLLRNACVLARRGQPRLRRPPRQRRPVCRPRGRARRTPRATRAGPDDDSDPDPPGYLDPAARGETKGRRS